MRKTLWVKPEIRAKFEAKMAECIAVAKSKRPDKADVIVPPILIFRQSGGRAGVCSARCGKGYVVLNYDLVHKVNTYDEMFNCTLPHEVAHWIVRCIWGWENTKPHGNEWVRVMEWLGADPEVKHDMDMTGVKRRQSDQTLFAYSCKCGFNHQLTAIRHRRHQAGRTRVCRRCRQTLVYKGIIVNGITAPVAQRQIEVPRETRQVIKAVEPVVIKGPQYRVVTKLVNGVLTNVRTLVES